MMRFRTGPGASVRRGRPGVVAGVLGLVIGSAAMLGGCSPDAEPPKRPETSPAVAPSGPTSGPTSSSAAPAPAPSSRLPLSPQAQAELDQSMIQAAKSNDLVLVTELIRAGGNVNAKDAIEDSVFLYAGAEGFNEILQLALASGADVASTNRFGGTALIPAAEHGHVDTVRILLAAGVPVDHVNKLGWTALQEAILLNNGGPRQQEVVRQLLAAGADPDIRDPQGRTALENAERLGFAAIAGLIRGR